MADATTNPVPLSKRSAIFHIGLGLIALACMYGSRLAYFAKYSDLMFHISALIGTGAVVAARVFLGPRICGLLEMISPTPAIPVQPAAAGTIVSKAAGPLVALFLIASAFVACAWGKAFVASEKTCQVANIPAEKQQGLAAVEVALADPLNWEATLINLVAQYGEEQVDCFVTAVKAADSAEELMDGGVKLAAAQVDRVKQTRITNANAWLKKHPLKKAK